MLDKYTFVAYAYRNLKDRDDLFSPFDRLLIHRFMTQGDALMSDEEMEKFNEISSRIMKELFK